LWVVIFGIEGKRKTFRKFIKVEKVYLIANKPYNPINHRP
jgi:hypothetical protein